MIFVCFRFATGGVEIKTGRARMGSAFRVEEDRVSVHTGRAREARHDLDTNALLRVDDDLPDTNACGATLPDGGSE